MVCWNCCGYVCWGIIWRGHVTVRGVNGNNGNCIAFPFYVLWNNLNNVPKLITQHSGPGLHVCSLKDFLGLHLDSQNWETHVKTYRLIDRCCDFRKLISVTETSATKRPEINSRQWTLKEAKHVTAPSSCVCPHSMYRVIAVRTLLPPKCHCLANRMVYT